MLECEKNLEESVTEVFYLIINLIYPDVELKDAALEFKKAFYDAGEYTIYGSYKLDQERYTYEQWLEIIASNLNKETANPKFGTSETWFAVNDQGAIVGIANLRHSITPFYADSGHVGISIPPRYRNQGYGKTVLAQIIEHAREYGLKEILLVCSKDNSASRATILSCGGVLSRYISDGEKEEYSIKL